MFDQTLTLIVKDFTSQYKIPMSLPCLLLTSAGTFMKIYRFGYFKKIIPEQKTVKHPLSSLTE